MAKLSKALKTALVTGASSGIGLELARLLAEEKRDLVLVARRAEKLERLARELSATHRVSARVIAKDLSNRTASREIAEELEREGIAVDVLVNNAGLGIYGRFWETDVERQLEVIQVNLVALTELTGRLLPGMIARGRGRILNLASTAAFQPGPYMAVYYATKAFVLSFSEALAEELRGTGVTATALCPGPTLTEFQEKAGLADTPLFRGPLVLDAATVARVGWEGAKRGKRVVVPGLANRILAAGARYSPRTLATKIARKLQEKRTPRND